MPLTPSLLARIETQSERPFSHDASALGKLRGEFWRSHLRWHPAEALAGKPNMAKSRWTPVGVEDLVVSQFLSIHGVGVFLRGPMGEEKRATAGRLAWAWDSFERQLGDMDMPLAGERIDGLFMCGVYGELEDRGNWRWMSEWLTKRRNDYVDLVKKALEDARPRRRARIRR